MSGMFPERMTYQRLAAELRAMADAVESGDSLEGFIEYLMPCPATDEEDASIGPDDVDVTARYRIGNREHGQGFMHIVGTFTPTPTTTTAPTET